MEKFIIVLLTEEQGRPYVYHSNNRFHESIWDIRGRKVVEYKSKKRAQEVAAKCCMTHRYGKSVAMTYDDYYKLCESIENVSKVSERLKIMQDFAEQHKENGR